MRMTPGACSLHCKLSRRRRVGMGRTRALDRAAVALAHPDGAITPAAAAAAAAVCRRHRAWAEPTVHDG